MSPMQIQTIIRNERTKRMTDKGDTKIIEHAKWMGKTEQRLEEAEKRMERLSKWTEANDGKLDKVVSGLRSHEAACAQHWKSQHSDNKRQASSIKELTEQVGAHEKKLIRIALIATGIQTLIMAIGVPLLLKLLGA